MIDGFKDLRTHPMMATLFIAFSKRLVCCSFGLCLLACSEPEPAVEPARPVRVTTVNFANTIATANYSGEVRVRHEPALAFQVPGKIAKRWVEVGATVKPGQLLATLDPPDFKFNEAGSAAQLNAAQAELDQARKDLLHANNLLEKQLTSPATVERRQQAVRAAEAHAAQAQAGLALSARKSAYTELRAEQAGVIAAVDAEAGQVVAAGQPIFRLSRTGEKEVVVNVPENHLDDVQSASEIKVSLWAKPGVFYPAKVREISPGVDALIRTLTVKVSILNPSDDVRMGMTATVHIRRTESRPIARLPLTALTQNGQQTVVWVFDPATLTVHPQPVELAGYEDENAKILRGLNPGDQVVTAGVHKLLPGEKVRLLEQPKP
jgi:multidrug efflux system membrane fusion protein